MTQKVIFDTSIFIGIERGQIFAKDILKPNEQPVLCSIVYAELLTGINLDVNKKRAAHNLKRLEQIKENVAFAEFGLRDATALAHLKAELRKSGAKRGKYDLMIAATARAMAVEILTLDKSARFADLRGVAVREV